MNSKCNQMITNIILSIIMNQISKQDWTELKLREITAEKHLNKVKVIFNRQLSKWSKHKFKRSSLTAVKYLPSGECKPNFLKSAMSNVIYITFSKTLRLLPQLKVW